MSLAWKTPSPSCADLRERYEIFHGVHITESAIHAAVFLSYRYITDRHLPDKAIDLIDEAASLIRMQIGKPSIAHRQQRAGTCQSHRRNGGMSRENTPYIQKLKPKNSKAKSPKSKKNLSVFRQQWDQEKKLIQTLKEKKNKLEQLRFQEEEV